MTAQLLEIHNVSKSFFGVPALKKVSLTVQAGTVHALLGENGAGKSTLMNLLVGIHSRDSGEIRLRGQSVNFHRPEQALHAGISIIQQELSHVPDMTVAENIFLGREPVNLGFMVDYRTLNKQAADVLDKLHLSINPKRAMKSLSLAEMQLVEITKAISYNSDIIIMDEPTSALGDQEIEGLLEVIRVLKSQGKGIIYISHKFGEIFDIADDATVLRDGSLIATLPVTDTHQDELVQLMTGKAVQAFPKSNEPADEVLLEVRNLTHEPYSHNLSFDLHQGEILGVFGLMGAGKSELLQALFGLTHTTGTLALDGKPIRCHSPAAAMNHGFALVTEDRKQSGLLSPLSVKDNVTIASLPRLNRAGVVLERDVKQEVSTVTQDLDVRMASPRQLVKYLSGGNQQKVILARWLLTGPRILLLDEPTRGIDIGAKSEIYKFMSAFASAGKGIILVSSELPEVLGMSDRILVLKNGRITADLARADASEAKLMQLAT
ncbi:MAG: sugar ABC transporter ATP-binding protein [Deinococcota bacterium]